MVGGSLCYSPVDSCGLPQGSGRGTERFWKAPSLPPHTPSHNQQAVPPLPTDQKSPPSPPSCRKPLSQEGAVMLSPSPGSECRSSPGQKSSSQENCWGSSVGQGHDRDERRQKMCLPEACSGGRWVWKTSSLVLLPGPATGGLVLVLSI